MELDVQARDFPLTEGLHAAIAAALRPYAAAFDEAVRKVAVRVYDLNGPRGGVDKRCQVVLKTDGTGPVIAVSVARDWRTALDQALARASRFLLRQWRRSADARRLRRRALSPS